VLLSPFDLHHLQWVAVGWHLPAATVAGRIYGAALLILQGSQGYIIHDNRHTCAPLAYLPLKLVLYFYSQFAILLLPSKVLERKKKQETHK